ncbi:MAG: HlyD family efflux transporter periplasmic adaptor subunit [Stenotrophomonas nitritireducens]|uniref:HlyD family secretion protein n=1 Tax=Stenotrophomonas nitritireducens TaxID=83617 RepID=UPI001ACE3844|nr:HlyD family secretion protein [Stenotrophomonas nitritireducens]MBN8769736.1 HlyD family efflux transporter periplasmic adaptor subunit [Stenotrophomonas sp.]MBN8790802.1 HlyD family efflux transporter periplasmic adaptor subunit [Stenotrophomonas nitritireducens]
MNDRGIAGALLLALALAGCSRQAPQALGTLEWDRVTVPAPVSERIVRIDVREGEQVAAGASLMQLEPAQTRSQLEALRAQEAQSGAALLELRHGPRAEDITQARAALAAAQAQAREAQAYHARLQPLAQRQLVAAAELDRARAAAQSAQAQVRQAAAALDELLHGSRSEQLAQGEAALASAQASATVQSVVLGKLALVAPRAGRIDSLPYKLGDQPATGAPLAILLVGDAPYARVYLPQALRNRLQVGDALRVQVQPQGRVFDGRVRMIRSEPVFTPYFALTGQDAERLSYLAEISLGKEAAALPVGAPVQVLADAAR